MIVAVRDRRLLMAKAPNLWSRQCSSRPSLRPDPGRLRIAHSTRLRKYTVRREPQSNGGRGEKRCACRFSPGPKPKRRCSPPPFARNAVRLSSCSCCRWRAHDLHLAARRRRRRAARNECRRAGAAPRGGGAGVTAVRLGTHYGSMSAGRSPAPASSGRSATPAGPGGGDPLIRCPKCRCRLAEDGGRPEDRRRRDPAARRSCRDLRARQGRGPARRFGRGGEAEHVRQSHRQYRTGRDRADRDRVSGAGDGARRRICAAPAFGGGTALCAAAQPRRRGRHRRRARGDRTACRSAAGGAAQSGDGRNPSPAGLPDRQSGPHHPIAVRAGGGRTPHPPPEDRPTATSHCAGAQPPPTRPSACSASASATRIICWRC